MDGLLYAIGCITQVFMPACAARAVSIKCPTGAAPLSAQGENLPQTWRGFSGWLDCGEEARHALCLRSQLAPQQHCNVAGATRKAAS
jgi:hypothetical protein